MATRPRIETAKDVLSPRKSIWRKVFVLLVVLVLVGVGVYFYRDKPAKLVQTENVDQNADPATGEIVDFAYAYNAAQDKALGPAEENGWRLILQTLGPLALEQRALAETVPWEEFPTNEKTKEWFEGDWTFLCEKFNLDPHERPTMLDRLWMWGYFAKNGVKGDEPIPDDKKNGTYRENFEEHPARVTEKEALDALLSKPWTAEEYPAAARGIEENADLYDVYAKAARSPKFGCWHRVPDAVDGGFVGMLLPDVQFTREIARQLQVRANYRIGSGDISGAIDDVETITLMARALLERENGCLVERLVGLACLGIANGVPFMGAPDVLPTADELARIAELRASGYRDGQAERLIDVAFQGESRYFCLGACVDYLQQRRQGLSFVDLYGKESEDRPFKYLTKFYEWLFINAPPLNDARTFQRFKDIVESVQDHSDDVHAYLAEESKVVEMITSSPENNNAIYAASLILPAFGSVKEVFHRTECVYKEGRIAAALLAYYQDHGTLPPALTLDPVGRPLHSWRVLILPYLGDDAKSLYDQIRLDEPWDSAANAAFHSQIPEVYRCVSTKAAKEGETGYSVLLGDDALFDASGLGKDFKKLANLPGRDVMNQFLVVERAKPICWMKPDAELRIADLSNAGEADPRKFFSTDERRHTGGMNCVRLGGDVHFYADTTQPGELQALMRGLPKPKESVAEESTTDGATTEATAAEGAVPGASAAEEPAVEAPTVEEPAAEESTVEESDVEEPAGADG